MLAGKSVGVSERNVRTSSIYVKRSSNFLFCGRYLKTVQFLVQKSMNNDFRKYSDFHFQFKSPYCHNGVVSDQTFYTISCSRHPTRSAENLRHPARWVGVVGLRIAGDKRLRLSYGATKISAPVKAPSPT
jgi:hypothetical protein